LGLVGLRHVGASCAGHASIPVTEREVLTDDRRGGRHYVDQPSVRPRQKGGSDPWTDPAQLDEIAPDRRQVISPRASRKCADQKGSPRERLIYFGEALQLLADVERTEGSLRGDCP